MSFDRLNSKRRAALPANAITLPYRFVPRSYQYSVLQYMDAGPGPRDKRGVMVWHRKSGKDLAALNYTICQMAKRPGLYWHLFPDGVQGRRILWDGINSGGPLDGMPIMDHFPKGFVIEKNETEALIRTHSANGQHSVWQLIGTDKPDRLRGPNPIGVVLSEFSYMAPSVWETVKPVLETNGGWALFAYTPNGQNHGWDLYRNAVADPSWYAERLTIENTRRDAPGEDGQPVVRKEFIESERTRGVPEEWLLQEYYCDFSGIRTGSYYGEMLSRAASENRITDVPYDPMLPAEVWWDLGKGQSIAVWVVQTTNTGRVRLVDCVEGKPDETVEHIARALLVKPYTYSAHVMPWDAKPYGDRSRVEWAERLGLKPIIVNPQLPVDDGISAVKALLPRCVFDAGRCAAGLKALRAYHREFDEKANTFKTTPKHDWASHFADAFRTGAVGTRGAEAGMTGAEVKVEQDFDPRMSMTREW